MGANGSPDRFWKQSAPVRPYLLANRPGLPGGRLHIADQDTWHLYNRFASNDLNTYSSW